MSDLSDDDLLAELGVETARDPAATHTRAQERIIAGFEDIQRWVETHGRAPLHGDGRDIFERLYAVRRDRIRAMPEARALLGAIDHQGLLDEPTSVAAPAAGLDDDELLAELGVGGAAPAGITDLRHVRPREIANPPDEIANRTRCKDFSAFKPLFQRAQRELEAGIRHTRPFERKAEIEPGRFFILGGQKAYVAEMGEPFTNEHGYLDSRLRVIFDNGTESNLLMRSLQRALNRDEAGRRITDPEAGPLFGATAEAGDRESGTIYVLRSRSDHPAITANRDLIHKIGVTGGKVAARIANARLDPTYLLAEVEIVATYELYNINRARLEALLHRFFAAARLDLELKDRFGNPVRPQEWFLVPLPAIDAAVQALQHGTIHTLRYDPATAALALNP